MKKVIINADDFGRAVEINEAIFEGYEKGFIFDSTILVENWLGTKNALSLIKLHPQCSTGLHLNIEKVFIEERWFRNKYGVIEADLDELLLDDNFIPKIRKHTKEQINVFIRNGIPISHMDCHHHLHLFPDIITNILDLLLKYKIRRIRFFKEFYTLFTNYINYNEKEYRKIKEILDINDILYCDHYIPLSHRIRAYKGSVINKVVNEILERKEGSTIEIGVHIAKFSKPKNDDEEHRNLEYLILKNELFETLKNNSNIKLINFNDLK